MTALFMFWAAGIAGAGPVGPAPVMIHEYSSVCFETRGIDCHLSDGGHRGEHLVTCEASGAKSKGYEVCVVAGLNSLGADGWQLPRYGDPGWLFPIPGRTHLIHRVLAPPGPDSQGP